MGLAFDPASLTVENLVGFKGLNIYYDPLLNPELKVLTFGLSRGGLLIPLEPEGASLTGAPIEATPPPARGLLLATGLLGLGLLGLRGRLG